MKKDDSLYRLLSLNPNLDKVYETILPEKMLKNIPTKPKRSLEKAALRFIENVIKNQIIIRFLETVKPDIYDFVSDIINPQSTEKVKKSLIDMYHTRGIEISEKEAESMVENLDNLVKLLIKNIQGEING